ncbi:hypothetical protein D2Q93_07840 [Alicyclobacillaceae bacterium I2511]|nr:hypothetical protein D2Q93_07840 [Alicyclobacillaceae bacterium I2511]
MVVKGWSSKEKQKIRGVMNLSINYTDPFAAWKKVYEQAEPKYSEILQQFLTSDSYSLISAQLMGLFMQTEQLFAKNMESLLEQYHVPSVKDIERLAELLVNVDDKLDQIEEKMFKLDQKFDALSSNAVTIESSRSLSSKEEPGTTSHRSPKETGKVSVNRDDAKQ